LALKAHGARTNVVYMQLAFGDKESQVLEIQSVSSLLFVQTSTPL